MSLEVIIVQGAGVEFSDLIRKYKEALEDLQLAYRHMTCVTEDYLG